MAMQLTRRERTSRRIEQEPRPQNNTAELEKKILVLEQIIREKEGENNKTVSKLEDARKEIETITTEKSEFQLIVQNCEEAAEGKRHFEAQLAASREEVESQKTQIMKLEKQLKFQGKILLPPYQLKILILLILLFTEEQTRMVSKIKQERSQPCDCKNKEKEMNQKLFELEEKYKAQKIQLVNKDREITGHIVENQKLMKKISELKKKTKYTEYIELIEDEED